MTRNELKKWVTARGASWPGAYLGGNEWFHRFLGTGVVGSGRPIDYSEADGRRLVAWQLCGDALGIGGDATLRLAATEEMVEHETGWIVITEGTVNWTRRPTARVFDRGAVCIPVPSW